MSRTIRRVFYFSLFSVVATYAQTTVLHVGTKEQLYIPAQSIVSMRGLVYEPSQDLTLTNNTLIIEQKVLHPLENAQPISYQWKNLISEYSGSISMSIEELDLKDEEKENLVMYHYNNKWIFNTQNQISDDRLSIQGTFVNSSFLEHSLSISEDSDFDGVMDSEDACPNTRPGAIIDITGCEVFTLPKNNFNLRAAAATCSGSNNGAIELSALDDDYTYTATITKSGTQIFQQTLSQSAGMTKSISALYTGSYQVCFGVEGQPGYSQCFSVNIAEPPALSASASVDRSTRLVTLNLSGSDKYYITHNGTTTTVDKQQVTIALRSGNNTLEVNTDLSCQGSFFEEVFVSEEVILYPNPTQGMIQVYVEGMDQSLSAQLRDLSGNSRIQLEMKVPQNRVLGLDLTELPTGVYLLLLSGETLRTAKKIIKE